MISTVALIGSLLSCAGVIGMIYVLHRKDKEIAFIKNIGASDANIIADLGNKKDRFERERNQTCKDYDELQKDYYDFIRTLKDLLCIRTMFGEPGTLRESRPIILGEIKMLLAANTDNNAEVNRKIKIINDLENSLTVYKHPLTSSLKYGQKVYMEGTFFYFQDFKEGKVSLFLRTPQLTTEVKEDVSKFEEGLSCGTITVEPIQAK